MSDAYVIEHSDVAVGLVTRDARAFRFHAAEPKVFSLDGQLFRSPEHAYRAVKALLASGRAKKSAARD